MTRRQLKLLTAVIAKVSLVVTAAWDSHWILCQTRNHKQTNCQCCSLRVPIDCSLPPMLHGRLLKLATWQTPALASTIETCHQVCYYCTIESTGCRTSCTSVCHPAPRMWLPAPQVWLPAPVFVFFFKKTFIPMKRPTESRFILIWTKQEKDKKIET